MFEHIEWWHLLISALTISFMLWSRELRGVRADIKTSTHIITTLLERVEKKADDAMALAVTTRERFDDHRVCVERRVSKLEVNHD